MIQSNKKNSGRVGTHGGSYQILIFRVFFSFNAVASLDYISLQAGGGGGGQVGGWGGGGFRQINIFFFYNFCPDYFFFKWEGNAGRGDDPRQLKKLRQGGHLVNIVYKFE